MSLPLTDRYEVRPTLSGDVFVIHDRAFGAACGLAGRVLSWDTRAEANAWLMHCYRVWGTDPALGEEPPPSRKWGARRYRPRHAGSPWATYVTPVEPWEIPYQR